MELWKDIRGYEGLYQVSNFGRVRNNKLRILKPSIRNNDGRYVINLRKDGKTKMHRVHRLVAEAFIPNPDNLPQINHKDENPGNNFVFVNPDGSVDFEKSNLEWCDAKYNNNYGTHKQRVSASNKNHPVLSKPVKQIDKQGDIVNIFPSAIEASRYLNCYPSQIIDVCNGHHKTARGFYFQYI